MEEEQDPVTQLQNAMAMQIWEKNEKKKISSQCFYF